MPKQDECRHASQQQVVLLPLLHGTLIRVYACLGRQGNPHPRPGIPSGNGPLWPSAIFSPQVGKGMQNTGFPKRSRPDCRPWDAPAHGLGAVSRSCRPAPPVTGTQGWQEGAFPPGRHGTPGFWPVTFVFRSWLEPCADVSGKFVTFALGSRRRAARPSPVRLAASDHPYGKRIPRTNTLTSP